jgi:predicted HTH domain antitoxin
MTEIPVATRIPIELENQLKEYMKTEHLEKASAIRKLLFTALQEWREEHALKLLAEKKVTLSKAAEIADIDIWSLIEKIKEAKIQWVDDNIINKDLESFKLY